MFCSLSAVSYGGSASSTSELVTAVSAANPPRWEESFSLYVARSCARACASASGTVGAATHALACIRQYGGRSIRRLPGARVAGATRRSLESARQGTSPSPTSSSAALIDWSMALVALVAQVSVPLWMLSNKAQSESWYKIESDSAGSTAKGAGELLLRLQYNYIPVRATATAPFAVSHRAVRHAPCATLSSLTSLRVLGAGLERHLQGHESTVREAIRRVAHGIRAGAHGLPRVRAHDPVVSLAGVPRAGPSAGGSNRCRDHHTLVSEPSRGPHRSLLDALLARSVCGCISIERLTDRSCEQGYYRKGLVMARLEDEDAAEKLFQHALTLQPRDPAAIQRALSAIGTKTPAELVRGLRASE